MPRNARIDLPDLLQHVIVRGVNRCDIFADDHDRLRCLERLSVLLVETHTECLAWALMPNHFHLLLRPRQNRLAHVMRRLLTGYAIYFNHRHQRSGHLFQNRYKSIVCDEEAYLLELVRYIHLNPLRTGLVDGLDALERYPWTGHAVLLGRAAFAGQQADRVLVLFAAGKTVARRAYRAFVADGVEMGNCDEFVGRRSGSVACCPGPGRDHRILGGEKFCEILQSHAALARRFDRHLAIDEVVRRVCDHFAVEPGQLRKRTKTSKIAEARSVICYLAVRELGHNGVEVGEAIGLRRSAVSRAAVRGGGIVEGDSSFFKLINK
jgi:REP element-mobilizing transposase RayT